MKPLTKERREEIAAGYETWSTPEYLSEAVGELLAAEEFWRNAAGCKHSWEDFPTMDMNPPIHSRHCVKCNITQEQCDLKGPDWLRAQE